MTSGTIIRLTAQGKSCDIAEIRGVLMALPGEVVRLSHNANEDFKSKYGDVEGAYRVLRREIEAIKVEDAVVHVDLVLFVELLPTCA